MNVILSIKPRFIEMILQGNKLFELRRVVAKNLDPGDRVLMYETGTGKVTGLFEVEDVLRQRPVTVLYAETGLKTGLMDDEFFKYFTGVEYGNAIKTKNPRRFKVPILLNDLWVGRAPQNFCHLKRFNLEGYTHSFGDLENPCWISLNRQDMKCELFERIQKSMQKYLDMHKGESGCMDLACSSPLMTRDTAVKLLGYSFIENRYELKKWIATKKPGWSFSELRDNCIDGGSDGWGSDTRDTDPLTWETLDNPPVDEDYTIEELNLLLKSESLDKSDWGWLSLVTGTFADDSPVWEPWEKVVWKHIGGELC